MEDRDDHKFLKLRDAIACLNDRVNLVGVVLEFGFPKKSRGTDFFISLRIADESYSDPGISVNFFAESVEKLPLVASPGDIILLSHVVMKTHEREVYALFIKKFTSFALYEGISGGDFIPYQVSARFRTRELNKKFIADLRKWLPGFQLNTDPNNFQYLREIKEGQRLSVICKILHIREVAEKNWIIYVWDGTDAPSKKIQTKCYEERLSEKWGRMPWSCFPSPSTVTEVEHDRVPLVTLRDVLAYPEVTAKFKCVIRVVAAFPCEAENFLSPGGTYRVRLTIEDPTARVHAFLYAEDGEKFFDGRPSTCVLKRRMNKLLGLNEDDDSKGTEYTDRDAPWVFCCLKSYYLNENDVWGSRCYRIFDTRCNFANFSRNIHCLKCKTQGPKKVGVDEVEKKKGDWNCPKCSFMNFASKRKCLRCEEPRPKRQLNYGEWECPSCDYLNYRRNTSCLKCNHGRPQEMRTEYDDQIWRSPR